MEAFGTEKKLLLPKPGASEMDMGFPKCLSPQALSPSAVTSLDVYTCVSIGVGVGTSMAHMRAHTLTAPGRPPAAWPEAPGQTPLPGDLSQGGGTEDGRPSHPGPPCPSPARRLSYLPGRRGAAQGLAPAKGVEGRGRKGVARLQWERQPGLRALGSQDACICLLPASACCLLLLEGLS